MRRLYLLILLSLSFTLKVDCQSEKDSILHLLYEKGLIGRRPSPEIAKEARDSLMNLRAQLKYKFALDFLLECKSKKDTVLPNVFVLSPTGNGSFFDTTNPYINPKFIHKKSGPPPKGIVEEFVLGDVFSLRKIKSFRGNKEYYLLVDSSYFHVRRFYLLADDTTHWVFLDLFDFERGEGSFKFEAVNGYNVIRTVNPNWSSGHYDEDESFLGIVDDRFKVLFVTRRIQIWSPEGQSYTVSLRKISLVDLNGDGFMDIAEKETIAIVPFEEFSHLDDEFHEGNHDAFYKIKTKDVIQKQVNKYYWNNATYLFEKGD